MKKAIVIILIVSVLANIPFFTKVNDYDAAYDEGSVAHYYSLSMKLTGRR